ncbi:MAG TPA: hypothetical protein VHJ34_06390, partial [Actinomycetota bacterium]|nr:hypothetical protein [Actinomycetota bacterium]
SDIFFRVISQAREPDKIPTRFLTWSDGELLLQLVEERYRAGRDPNTPGSDLWRKYFERTTRGMPTREYMASRVLPRPRDILYLANAAIDSAVRHRREKVTSADVLEAERQYSQFAFEALLVEGSGDVRELEDLLFEFAGADEILTMSDLVETISKSSSHRDVTTVLDQLVALSFLGREVHEGAFEFAENPRDRKRLDAVARGFATSRGADARYRIHPAYQAYLNVAASDSVRQQAMQMPSS